MTSKTPAPAEPTPELLQQLTDELTALKTRIEAAAAGAERTKTRSRLETAAGWLAQARTEAAEAAADLRRVAAVPADACRVPWGVCPEHGNTLSASGGRTWCRVRGCGHEWDYDYQDTPCAEPATYAVIVEGEEPRRVCYGHALAGRDIVGARFEPPLPAGAVAALDLLTAAMKLTGDR
jgi:hypothetical protein